MKDGKENNMKSLSDMRASFEDQPGYSTAHTR